MDKKQRLIHEEATWIYKQLPHGSMKKICEMTNVSSMIVYRVLNGKTMRINVIEAIVEVFKRVEKQNKELLNSLVETRKMLETE